MGTGEGKHVSSSSVSAHQYFDISILGLRMKHQQELESLTLTTQPFKTLKYFILAVILYVKRSVLYILAKGGWLMLLSTLVMAIGLLLMTFDGPHEKVLKFAVLL